MVRFLWRKSKTKSPSAEDLLRRAAKDRLQKQREDRRRREREEDHLGDDFDKFTRTGVPQSSTASRNPNRFDNNWFIDGSYFTEGGTVICTVGKPHAYFCEATHTFHSYVDGRCLYHYDLS